MPDPAPSAPDATAARSWVWHASVESRAAGKVSVLACVETLAAVALYWWIAIRYDTYWHLLSSVFIAPLLLLRSSESMKLGVRLFMKDWFGFKKSTNWSRRKFVIWLSGAAILSSLAAYALALWLSGVWLAGQTGWSLFGWAMIIGGLSMGVGNVFTGAITFARSGAVHVCAVLHIVAILSAVAGVSEWESAGIGVNAGALTSIGLSLNLRALLSRLAATIWCFPQGIRRLAENWQENNFWIDLCVPAELMPGIREVRDDFALDGFIHRLAKEKKWTASPFAIILFLPAFLYRLNIKATCWFWWPLAYLLKPVPKADKVSAQKQALCWPWDNPWQRLLIFVPAVLMCFVLIDRYSDFSLWQQYQNPDAVPVPLKLVLGMQWSHLPPWHVAMLLIAGSGLGMLALSGNARSHKANDNWDAYAQAGMPMQLWLMNALAKVRSLATVAFLLLGLGMCLISFPEWRQHLPASLLLRLEHFYHTQEQSVPAPAGHSPGQ